MEDNQQPTAKILVVDDELGLREGCRRALVPLGHSVDTAESLTVGQEMIRDRTYDLCLLDVMLPDGSGLDLLALIHERDPSTICIVITGFGSIEMAVEAVRRGAYDFLSKPFTSDELLLAVNQGLERRRLLAVEAQARELARTKEDLEKLDQLKSQFMLQVAHELRAPAAAIQSYINLILSGYVEDKEMNPTLKRMQERLTEMLSLIADLLELAKLKQAADRLSEKASPQPLADILLEVCDLLREQANEKRQRLKTNIRARPLVTAHREHLQQIWTNLISNAIKYTPEGGRITATLRVEGNMAIGEVQDSGIGIAQQDMVHLFQEFYRTDQAKASGEIGTGLGLSIVKQIVESYNGKIEVTSKLGEGSRFTFSLPLKPPDVERS